MKKYTLWILAAIFILGFIVRLYRFDNPVADWHSFRQGDTNAVSERYAREGIDFLYPKYFDVSNVQSGIDNPEGFRYVEFPLYNALQASLFNALGVLTLAEWGRIITIIASLLTGLFILLLTRKYAGERAAFFALIFFLFLPFSVFYGRVLLPDTSMTAAIFAGIYFFDRWITLEIKHKKKKLQEKILSKKTLFYIAGIVFCSLAFLLKPFALFFTLPLIYLSFKRFGFSLFLKWQLWLFAGISLAPFISWRVWISQFPEGIPASDWLFNGNGIRFRPAFFRWIFYERLTVLILGFVGTIFFALGFIGISKVKNTGFFLSFILSSLIYVFVIATGNVQHDYYQTLLIPTIAMIAGIGAAWLFGITERKLNIISAIIICVILTFSSFYFSWNQVKDYFNINDRGMVAAGVMADKILPEDAVIIAPYDGSTTLLNISARPGWPVFQKSIEELIEAGATHLVIANPTENDFNGFGQNYTRIAAGKDYLILRLTD